MAKMREFEEAEHCAEREPSQSDMGASVLNYGEQRFSEGLDGEEPETYAEPGDEGEIAVGLMKAMGGISSHESFDSPMSGTPTGE